MSLFLVFTALCGASLSALYLWRAARRREIARARLSPRPAGDPANDASGPKSLLASLIGIWERAGGRRTRLRRYILPMGMVLAVLVFTRNPFLSIAAWPACTLARRFLHRQRSSKAWARKEEQVLEFIDSLSQSLRSGLSLRQSLELSLEDIGEELGVDVLEVLKDIRVGGGLEESLTRAADRSTSPSLRLTFTVLGLLHAKGGDLPRILDRLRKRVAGGLEVRREARMLTAQSRASGYLVSSLPAVFLLLQAALNPRSLHPLFTTAMGNLIVITAVALNAAAFYLIRKMVNPEV